ncbi:MAG: haloacid dehalogenase-like hydrolase [Candidatus Eisenbacteria bacterium]
MGVAEPPGSGRRGVVAFDVDGVLLQGLFLSRVASTTSAWIWIRSMWLGFLLKVGALDIRQVVERAYAFQRGVPLKQLLSVGDSLHLAHGARKLCAKLREVGYHVVLVSAGVPQQVVERIASHVGADGAYGVLLEEVDGVLTGRLLGDRHSARGKRRGLERMLREQGFAWSDATVVVDDGSNRDIVAAAWRSIGVNPEWRILRKADFVVYTRDLYEILEFFPEGYKVGVTLRQTAILHEAFRKAIHSCSIAVPILATWWKTPTLWLVGLVTIMYLVSEVMRLLGVAVPVFSAITWRAMRPTEPRTVVVGPFLFGVGIFSVVAFFEPAAATVGVLVLAIGDSAASLVGRAFGNTTLPYNPGKTVLGSLSLFAVGVLVAIFFVSVPWAILVGAVASLVESLPLGPSDNLLLPLATAGIVTLALT